MKDIEFAITVLEADLDKRRKAVYDAHLTNLTTSQISGLLKDIECLYSAIKKLKIIWDN
ncbi:hypothetical protein LCM23_06440 [Cytobacillus kochii]|uniref:hypothetical protein n=1 Tax=Cytobacillus kochii TaxID=859143 RepID=UPI001CD58AEC|nr:hypothetical protein [Cytobacillus kochii]MCA1025724.1 hypothetical protein [Cytobacillus kochii]